jgi:hypothetical protein
MALAVNAQIMRPFQFASPDAAPQYAVSTITFTLIATISNDLRSDRSAEHGHPIMKSKSSSMA